MKNCNIKHNTIDQSNLRNVTIEKFSRTQKKNRRRDDRIQRIKFSDQNFSIVFSFFYIQLKTNQKSYDEIDITEYFHENVLAYKHLNFIKCY